MLSRFQCVAPVFLADSYIFEQLISILSTLSPVRYFCLNLGAFVLLLILSVEMFNGFGQQWYCFWFNRQVFQNKEKIPLKQIRVY
ncbi:MAG: hypothetical protein ABI947_26730 [Chloroflexota bacterium]